MNQTRARPLVSIVTPVLNRASTVGLALASVAAQTYPNIEHIVVDGGSIDGTVEILKRFVSPLDFHWVSEADRGMYEAINKGFSLARGEMLAYINSDDLYLPWSVEVAVSHLSTARADIVYGDMGMLRRARNFRPKFYRPFDIAYYTHFEAIGQPSVFWKAAVTDRIGHFDETYQLIGDCEYWLRAAAAGFELTHVDEILAIQVEHGETLRQTRPDDLRLEFNRLRREYTAVAGPRRRQRLTRLKDRIRWRRLQLEFILLARLSTPAKWARFLAFLRERRIPVDRSGLLWYLLPARLWPLGLSTVDADLFERRLVETIEAATRPSS
jgi:glycosyltransferase involved in cell wall biosynthesis